MPDIEMIDDAYWLKFAKDHVSNAITAREEAANKIDTFLGIIWPVYTTIFTTAIVFHQLTDNIYVIIIMALPVIIIPLARFLCLRVLLPPLVRFYPNIPADIEKNVYAKTVLKKSSFLLQAQVGAFIAALSIGLSLFIYKISDGTKNNYYVETVLNASSKNIQIEGRSQPNKEISISLAGTIDTAKKVWAYQELKVKSDAQGLFHSVLANNGMANNLKVFVSWIDNNSTQTIKSQ